LKGAKPQKRMWGKALQEFGGEAPINEKKEYLCINP